MDASFWHQKWETNDIGFHLDEANPALVKHFNRLSLAQGARVFLPLCGKTRDIAWLLANGFQVAGAELSETAIVQLFKELGVKPKIAGQGSAKHYSAGNIDIHVDDIFELTPELLGAVDAVYDRAALVALPDAMRRRYVAHVAQITDKAPQLLLSFEYDQALMEGPPFSVSNEEIRQYYGGSYEASLIESADIPGGLKGQAPAKENVWLLRSKRLGDGALFNEGRGTTDDGRK